jgi:hypothetical protein
MRLDGYWMNIKKPPDFLQGTSHYLAYLRRHRPAELGDTDTLGAACEGNVLIDPSAKIGKGCKIGPDVVIGAGCVVEDGVRLARCILLDGVRALRGPRLDPRLAVDSWQLDARRGRQRARRGCAHRGGALHQWGAHTAAQRDPGLGGRAADYHVGPEGSAWPCT